MKLSRPLHLLTAVLAASVLLLTSHSTALADDARDFDISNESSYSMTSVWLAPSAATDWGYAINPSEVPSGAVLHITFPYAAPGACMYDLHIAYNDGRPDQLSDLNICNVLTIHITDTQITLDTVQ